MIKKSLIKTFVLLPAVALVSGCIGDRVEQVENKMLEIRNKPAKEISQPPIFDSIKSFSYGAEKLRSPFMPPSLQSRLAEEAAVGDQVLPDEGRPKEQLEQFDLSQLVMRGIMQEPTGERYALVEDPTGKLIAARVGNYMGTDYGRIVEINAREINLIEIVPNGSKGYVERPKTILAPET